MYRFKDVLSFLSSLSGDEPERKTEARVKMWQKAAAIPDYVNPGKGSPFVYTEDQMRFMGILNELHFLGVPMATALRVITWPQEVDEQGLRRFNHPDLPGHSFISIDMTRMEQTLANYTR